MLPSVLPSEIRSLIVLPVVFTFAAAGCTDDPPDDAFFEVLEPGQRLFVMPGENAETWIGRADGFAVDQDAMAIVDGARRQVHLLDLESRTWRESGEEGRGPGEFLQPVNASFIGNELWIGDLGNGRITRLSRAGKYLGSLAVDVPLTFAQDDGGNVIARSTDLRHLFQVASTDSTWYLGSIDSLPPPFANAAETLRQPNFIIIEPLSPGTFALAENERGTLWIASVSDRNLELQEVPMPRLLSSQMQEAKADMEATFAGGWAPMFGSLHADGAGDFWVRPIPIGVLGFLVDGVTGQVTTVVRETERRESRGVTDSLVRGDTLFLLTETDVRAYALRPAR